MLWTTRTPLRVSLFGGGTDYPEYFERRPGAVVGFAIDKFIHIAALRLTAFQDYNYRVAYSKLELVGSLDEIEHPVVREALRYYGIADRLDISVMSDLPASGSGLGSSSAFTVGFANIILTMLQRKATKIDLARAATFIERDLLRENVGVQDQLHTAHGGVNRFDFEKGRVRITPVQLSGDVLDLLGSHMVLIHTGIGRRATTTVAEQLEATKSHKIDDDLSHLYNLVSECVEALERPGNDLLHRIGDMLSESWKVKRGLSGSVSNQRIDELFEVIIANGAYGAKLCGAGGGGFFFALVPPERQASLIDAVAPRAVIPIDIDVHGTTLVYQAEGRERLPASLRSRG
jgi:D-glycero-alpha-D-manno-heptose-7-phosphate kinase